MAQVNYNQLFQTFRLLHEEGFFVGASTGLNVSAAVQVARKMGPGHTIVTCLCDTGQVCVSKCTICLFTLANIWKELFRFQ